MKHGCVVLLSLLMLFLCSCSGAQKISPLLEGIAFTAKISIENEIYTCDVTLEKSGSAQVAFSHNGNFSGQTLTFSDNCVTTEFSGLSRSYKFHGAKTGSPSELLIFVLRDARRTQNRIKAKNGDFLLRSRFEGITYTLHFGATGLPVSLEIKEKGLSAEFQNTRIL